MKRAVIIVGLGFGDEGKGAAVDYLTRACGADLVIRYCGGCQAGHNVQLPDGRRHTFSQYGAGTLAGARTYLGPAVVIDPPALRREAAHLTELGVDNLAGLLTVHPACLVTTAWHKALNRLREAARGAARHGSCGQGVGEARSYWLKHGHDAVCAADLTDRGVLRDKLELQRQRALLEIQEFIECIEPGFLHEMDLWDFNAEAVASELHEAAAGAFALSEDAPECGMAIFEGAQGVLLDEYRGFHPHTTWSTVTPHHAWELIALAGAEAVAVLGVTRAYTTRHGEGPLPTFSAALTARLPDPGNPRNRWQGGLRCGWLDLPLLGYAAAAAGPLDGLIVNHLDQVEADWQVCGAYRNVTLAPPDAPDLARQGRLNWDLQGAEPVLSPATAEDIIGRLDDIAPVVLCGMGPTHEQQHLEGLSFRRRRSGPKQRATRNGTAVRSGWRSLCGSGQ